jgi:hypothetical protein
MDNISIAMLEDKVRSGSHIVIDVSNGKVVIRNAEKEEEKILFSL